MKQLLSCFEQINFITEQTADNSHCALVNCHGYFYSAPLFQALDYFSSELQCLPCSLFNECGHNEVKYSGWVGHRVLYIRGVTRGMRARTWPDDAQCHQVNNVLTPEHLANVSLKQCTMGLFQDLPGNKSLFFTSAGILCKYLYDNLHTIKQQLVELCSCCMYK